MNKVKTVNRLCIGLFAISVNPASAITPVLDGYAYQVNSDVTIDLENHNIIFESNMLNCFQPNNNRPLDTVLFAIITNNQFIGINHFTYNTNQDRIYFTSETSNLTCENGTFVDTLFYGDFEN